MTDWHSIFTYSEESPSRLFNKINRHPRAKIGAVSGNQRKDGYWITRYKGKNKLVHRIIFEMFHGAIPDNLFIDHIDRNCSNNSIDNLRLVNRATNARNMKQDSRNKSGLAGVTRLTVPSRGNFFHYWCATWFIEGKTHVKHFSVLEHGEEVAKSLAVQKRIDEINKLNEDGAGYTDNHGVKESK